jgi:hypothetical protein
VLLTDGEKKDREDRDKRVERGGPPAPKEKHGASSWTSSRTREGQMWGKVKLENTMNFDEQQASKEKEGEEGCPATKTIGRIFTS